MATLTTEDQAYLQTILSFGNKLITEDASITTEITSLNGMTLATDDLSQIEGLIQGEMISLTSSKITFLTSVIKALTIIDQAYFTAILQLSAVNTGDLAAVKTAVSQALAQSYSFATEAHFFNYYKRVSLLAIITRDSATIQAAITKIQSL